MSAAKRFVRQGLVLVMLGLGAFSFKPRLRHRLLSTKPRAIRATLTP